MITRTLTGSALTLLLLGSLLTGCTGGTESNAAVEQTPSADAPDGQTNVDARQQLRTIGDAIPVYADAQYREDLTKRDAVALRNQFGDAAEVYTLASDDSFPQVYHYYTTYLSQFRAFPARDTLPSDGKQWRTLEVQLNQAMQDPFIPGRALNVHGKQVTLQIAETEAEPKTVIRYIVTPAGTAAPAATVAAASPAAPVAR
ncbi:MAG TPA: hypothetical protein VGF48_06385 [Thermoanaerobaculia bacterium]|jgi:hypothetical protein